MSFFTRVAVFCEKLTLADKRTVLHHPARLPDRGRGSTGEMISLPKFVFTFGVNPLHV